MLSCMFDLAAWCSLWLVLWWVSMVPILISPVRIGKTVNIRINMAVLARGAQVVCLVAVLFRVRFVVLRVGAFMLGALRVCGRLFSSMLI